MKTLLRIDASAQLNGSNTRQITDYYEAQWKRANPAGRVTARCLVSAPIPHLTQETIERFQVPGSEHPLSDTLSGELMRADHVLIGSPLYNFTLPSTLKAYFDHVVRSGRTFELREGRFRGLLGGKSATIVTSRGGTGAEGHRDDFQTPYLPAILEFIGIGPIDVVALEGTALGEGARAAALERARRRIDQLLGRPSQPAWHGNLTEADQGQISVLRAGQADAIVAGNAQAYAALCTEDIQLLIPGHDVVSGREAFLQAERTLFQGNAVASFRKFPFRVEGSGDLAVETGYQEVVMNRHEDARGVFSTRQKYTHVFRRTERGWRFALLMSNPME